MVAQRPVALTATLLVCLGLVTQTVGCIIQGHDIGECRDYPEFVQDMEFCGIFVRYRACVPKENPNYPEYDVRTKDLWVRETYRKVVDTRIAAETNETLQDLGVNERGEPGKVYEHFFENTDCSYAYMRFFCWLNFPRCDDEDNSLILCRSVCENYFTACNYPQDLWRCYSPMFYGGKSAEQDDILTKDGTALYWRTTFPGLPFRDNQYDDEGNEIVVCTPSITNAESASVRSSRTWSQLTTLFVYIIAVAVMMFKLS